MNYQKVNNTWKSILSYYRKNNDVWEQINAATFENLVSSNMVTFGGEIKNNHTLSIGGISTISGASCSFTAIYDNVTNVTSAATWSIVSGSSYAIISAHTGEVEILSTANDSDVIIQASYLNVTSTKNVTLTYKAGTTSKTETETITDASGNTTTTTTTVVTNEDGSSSSSSSTVIIDENGDTIGSSESNTETNSDGSYNSTTTNFDANGDPVDATNVSGDTSGNVDTQSVAYDESGNSVVTSYTIDTTGNPDGVKNINGNGTDTQYYAFDLTHGFQLDFHFTINFNKQPANQHQNHHNILTMKRATPEPWYGFQLRQSSSNKYIQLGTQFSSGTNTNTTIASAATATANTSEYDLTIIYNPTADTNNFVCINNLNGETVFASDRVFPDIPELRYLTVTIGCAIDENGDQFRYSNINVINFNITRLSETPDDPIIVCDGESVTITCATVGASVYYKLNGTGDFALYSTPIPITADTTVQAYSELNGNVSSTVSETCLYGNTVESPVIYCDGENVTISCETPSADIYYRLNQTGNYSLYEFAIPITADTTVQAYAELNSNISSIVTESCIYVPGVKTPVVSCDGKIVTITCESVGATIYYKVDDDVSYSTYSTPITITADTTVYTYAVLNGNPSSVVIENCIYIPTHDYSQDYLTFKILTNGTVCWKAVGSNVTKTIQYSKNDGTWTSITATTGGTSISVVAGDKLKFKGSNDSYAKDKNNYSGFDSGGTAQFNIEGNIMSLIHGDNFTGQTTLTSAYTFCSIFKLSNVVSAENLILPATTLSNYCYRAMFSKCGSLIKAPALPATELSKGCYWYMFEECAITTAPDLPATTLVSECYGHMFTACTSLNYIKCLAVSGFTTTNCKTNWVNNVATSGTFVKSSSVNTSTWSRGANGIPTNWLVYDDVAVVAPTVSYDGFDTITITCSTQGANIYYRLNQTGEYILYATAITISADTTVETYSTLNGQTSATITQTCVYVSDVPIEASNRDLKKWNYNGQEITTPYSINAIDGHSSRYLTGTFNFETSFALRQAQPTYLWFQHADQSATIYVNDTLVEKHWGGYAAFTTDISNYVQSGTNTVKVALKNNEGSNLAPAAGDFNYNATLGNVRLLTSPVLPATNYGYDGFHVTSTVSQALAVVNVKTLVPTGATVVCTITDGTYTFTDTQNSNGQEMTFIANIANPHLWNGTADPYLYTITLEIYKDNVLYHRFQRPYGLRYYQYVINDTSVLQNNDPYTGFLLNGSPYLLRGVCMHDDIDGKANALTDEDYAQTFSIIQELGCNFIRLAHYPHPKEVYDRCDQLGIIVQTEAPCVNKMQSTMPSDYYTHLNGQYDDMVNQHYNHPCILFWGLSNETTTDDKAFANEKINGYISRIKELDSERWVGYVMAAGVNDPSAYYNNPNADWFGCNIYVGWYTDTNSNNPTTQITTRINNTITNKQKPLAYSEYGCGGVQTCHSDDFMATTTRGNHERHDIEYMMWLHEGQIAAIKNFPQLLFTAEWQLFDIAVANRNEGYTVCLDGETTSIDDNLRRLNDKGLVERDHRTKKDTFYLYKAWWNPQSFVHICGKNYTKTTSRVIKCYTNVSGSLSLYVNNTFVETVNITNNIATFTARNFNSGDVVRVEGGSTNDTFTFK